MRSFLDPPDPAGSPNEKLTVARRSPSVSDFAQYLLNEGVDPDTAEKIGRAVLRWEDEKHYDDLQGLVDLETWSNIHTHDGLGGGGGPGGGEATGFIMVGGHDGSVALSDVRYYDLDTDTWSARTPVPNTYLNGPQNLPVVGNRVFVIDGTHDGSDTGAVLEYAPVSDLWFSGRAPRPPGSRGRQARATAYDELIYVAGGRTGTTLFDTFQQYDPATDVWSTLAPLPEARAGGAFVAYDGALFYVGGDTGTGDNEPTSEIYKYDIATDVWSTMGGTVLRHGAWHGLVGTELLVAGGTNTSGSSTPGDGIDFYDVVADTVTAGTSTHRGAYGAAAVGHGFVHAAGGWSGSTYLSTMRRWESGAWTSLAVLPSGRAYHGLAPVAI